MAQNKGLLIAVGENKSVAVERAIDLNDRFTTVVSTELSPKKAELCLVSLTGREIDFLAISQAGRLAVTGQKTVAITRLVSLGGLEIGAIKNRLARRFENMLPNVFRDSTRISPRLWENLLRSIVAEYPKASKSLSHLRKLVAEFQGVERYQDGGLEAFERDAVASVLEVWGSAKLRKRVLRNAGLPTETEPAPFITRLTDVSIREDLQIIHDATTFPGMEVAERYQVGAVVFENDRERLTVINCNRQPLERTLGVDLIYYNHRFDSFIFVQYKRMVAPEEGDRKAVYRPDADKNYAGEIERMENIQQLIREASAGSPVEAGAYRLSSHPFYFKLCEARLKSALDEGMISGMYLPIEFWNCFMNGPESKGERGGRVVGWDNCPRHFSNSEFTGLLRDGWIGSAPGESKVLSELIRTVIEGDHMLIIAATSTSSGRKDFLRDTMGRFASEDDPHGAR